MGLNRNRAMADQVKGRADSAALLRDLAARERKSARRHTAKCWAREDAFMHGARAIERAMATDIDMLREFGGLLFLRWDE